MKKILIALIFCALTGTAFAQKIDKVYLNPNDSTVNRYLVINPAKTPYMGFMFLIPSFSETPEMVLEQTNLPKIAVEKGILTIIPTFSTGVLSMGADRLTQQSFKEILADVINKYRLTETKFLVGGFSMGGTCAVKFAELAHANNYKYKPAAVFAIDPPLDFEKFYNSSKRTIRLGVESPLANEAKYMIERIEQEMGGTPQTALQNYYKISPYSYSDATQSAIKNLINTPIRIYSEPDINWWIRERGSDLYEMNVLDASAMINELNMLGNKNAELILTENKGYRFRQGTKIRHPHSWSIAEPNELVDWLLK